MIYNRLGKTNLEVSRLGFGTMRLPTKANNADIDKVEASKMLKYAIENGVNIIDTAYPYHAEGLGGSGESERFLGEFLTENTLRDEIILQTKSPSWAIEERGDFERYLTEQLEKLQTDHIDIYLLHSLTVPDWEKVKNLDVLDFSMTFSLTEG
jgi:predicted aldo/keto reductase-like oxidoreductase